MKKVGCDTSLLDRLSRLVDPVSNQVHEYDEWKVTGLNRKSQGELAGFPAKRGSSSQEMDVYVRLTRF